MVPKTERLCARYARVCRGCATALGRWRAVLILRRQASPCCARRSRAWLSVASQGLFLYLAERGQ